MIHVDAMPEPEQFDATVRQKGLAFLHKSGIDLSSPLPSHISLEPYWRNCLDDLYQCYNGICAYLCVHFERITGGGSVDHFIAKSKRAGLAYEWANYRLACTVFNSRKRDYDDVLDPFEIENGWFHLELVTGHIYPNPGLDEKTKNAVQNTITRLHLDDKQSREVRARHFQEYKQSLYTEAFLKIRSPFVWREAERQRLL